MLPIDIHSDRVVVQSLPYPPFIVGDVQDLGIFYAAMNRKQCDKGFGILSNKDTLGSHGGQYRTVTGVQKGRALPLCGDDFSDSHDEIRAAVERI